MKLTAIIISQTVYDGREDFDIIIKDCDNGQETTLQCADKAHSYNLAKLLSKCVNFVDDYKVLSNFRE